MGRVNDSGGFTIIEVVLFLGVTGILFAALMLSVGSGISQQRYLDSVRAYKAFVQDQYAAVTNVDNRVTDNWECQADGLVNENSLRSDRGTSECVILGRIIQISPSSAGATSLQTSSVTGRLKAGISDVQGKADITAILDYQPHIAGFDREIKNGLEWGSYLTTSASPRRDAMGTIAILRSPSTGVLRVFVSANTHPNSDLSDLITQTNATTPLYNCIANDSPVLMPKQLVTIDPRIASADGVILDGGNDRAC